MRKFLNVIFLVLGLSLAVWAWLFWYMTTSESREPTRIAFEQHCAGCHGNALQGASLGPALVGGALSGGGSSEQLLANILGRHSEEFTTSLHSQLSEPMIRALSLFVSERRQRFPSTAESFNSVSLEQQVDSQYYTLRSEIVTELEGNPFSLAALPDGRFLVVEKSRGLSIIDQQGKQWEPIANTPKAWPPTVSLNGMRFILGMMLDVALHPDFESNGWIYLSHSQRCQLDCGSLWPVSMVRVVRGRIRDNRWVDEEVIWSVHHDYYTIAPDNVACGRLAFDQQNNLYITVGGKWTYDNLHNMDTPFGKIHRVRDDGAIPQDNPFWIPEDKRTESSTRHTVWSYGHRTAQGLAAHPQSGNIWSTEMGPRGGDEINHIERSGNYGWPLYTNGLDYDGQPISIGEDLGLDFPIEDTVLPVVDFTPAPAISNFTFYQGERLAAWQNDMLVGSLKAQTLYRVRVQDGNMVEQEKLLTHLGRIRDVEVGADGYVYLAIENIHGGAIVRLGPQ